MLVRAHIRYIIFVILLIYYFKTIRKINLMNKHFDFIIKLFAKY